MKLKHLCDYENEVQEAIGYHFQHNISLLYQAFTRTSYSVENGGENNEVLEFIGDRVLDFYVTKEFADRFGFYKSETKFFDPNNDDDEFCIKAHRDESNFTELKKELVSNNNLSSIVDELQLAQFLFLGQCDIDNKVWNQTKVKADLLEAIIGAVALDCNWDADTLSDFICYLLDIDTFLEDIEDGVDEYPDKCKLETAINSLKELFEHGYISEPIYNIPDEMIEYEGKMRWSADCYIRSHRIQVGAVSDSKKGAKRYAAYLALCKYYGVEPEE